MYTRFQVSMVTLRIYSITRVNMIFVLAFIVLLILCYFYITRNHSYWARRYVKCDKPIPLFGNHFQNVVGNKSITNISVEMYNKYRNEKVVGYYRGNTPELIIRDPDLIRQILNVDFAYFYPRGLGRNPDNETLSLNLFHVEGDKWKLLRQRLTGAFTTSKLKSMFPLVVRCAEKLQSVATAVAARGEEGGEVGGSECDVRELMARFTTEFIGACGFGIEMDTINNEHSQFRELGKIIFHRDLSSVVKTGLIDLFPILVNHLIILEKEIEEVVLDILRNIRKQRNGKPIGRNDFIDLLLELEMNGKIEGDSIEKRNTDGSPVHVEMELDLRCMAAQIFIFFAAGFETSSHATSYTLHQLAYNPDVQSRIQEEIDRVMLKYDNKLSYNAISEMSLLDMAFKESMRKFPSLGCLNRVCAKKYVIPELNISIDPGVKIIVPVQAIQNDEQYFDNPEEFRPERFLPQLEKQRHKFVYLPFGEGPRACIGARLGQMQSLAGLAAVLHKFTLEPGPSSTPTLQINNLSNVVQSVKNGVQLVIKDRKNKYV